MVYTGIDFVFLPKKLTKESELDYSAIKNVAFTQKHQSFSLAGLFHLCCCFEKSPTISCPFFPDRLMLQVISLRLIGYKEIC